MTTDFDEIVSHLKYHHHLINKSRLKKVVGYATLAHMGQIRHTGEPSIEHPLAVASRIASWGLDQTAVEAAILHETVDLSKSGLQDVYHHFGDEVGFLVENVNKIGQVKLRNSINKIFVENLRKMFISMAKDIRVVMIRLADRLHNMQTLDAIPLSKQRRIALETLEIYAPLAERLGMGNLKGDLEDLAFPYVYPQEYNWVSKIAQPHLAKAEKATQILIHEIKLVLSKQHLETEVHGRHKRRYSLYRKLLRPEIAKDINNVHDLIAIRIITQNKTDCYAVLGLVHSHWKPVPHLGISDFIAQPKPNGYQSIHTKVFDRKGHIVEIQIRTRQMHLQAEFGAAAHYAYAEAKSQPGVSSEQLDKGIGLKVKQKMKWISELALWQQQVSTSQEFTTSLKLDALSSHIYVFSPKGDVYDLPINSTPIDFAFAVHGDLGLHLQSVSVNGHIVPLDYILHSGDIISIVKTKHPRPIPRDWLHYAKTPKAISHIKKYLSQSKI